MKLPFLGILSGLALATLGISGAAQAAILLPSLPPGSQYRLLFLTSGTTTATSSDINTYNTFVNNTAQASTDLNAALTAKGFTPSAIEWKALASTATTNANVNTTTQATDPSFPFYRLDGALVVSPPTVPPPPTNTRTFNQLFYNRVFSLGGGADTINYTYSPINVNENGTTQTILCENALPGVCAWTGFNSNGAASAPLGDQFVLAGDYNNPANGDATSAWNSRFILSSTNQFPLYGISSVLTVPTPAATTPEPSSLLGFITLGGLLLGSAARKAKK